MGFRLRLGPFTFGRSGIRLSLWLGGVGFSAPLFGKGRTYGKVGIGPLSWYGQSGERRVAVPVEKRSGAGPHPFTREEVAAIEAFGADQRFLERLQQYGMPWRGVQERLKEELPPDFSERDSIAYDLVPRAMGAIFGDQGGVWTTEKRPSKSGSGSTTWIVVKRSRWGSWKLPRTNLRGTGPNRR